MSCDDEAVHEPNAVHPVSYATTRKKQRKIYIPAISTPMVVFHSRREIAERRYYHPRVLHTRVIHSNWILFAKGSEMKIFLSVIDPSFDRSRSISICSPAYLLEHTFIVCPVQVQVSAYIFASRSSEAGTKE